MFEEFLSTLSEADGVAMQQVIDEVSRTEPEATEGRSYGLPAFRYRDKPLLGLGAARTHLALYPFSPAVVEAVSDKLDASTVSKGTVRFTADAPLPDGLVARLVQLRRGEIDGA